MNIIELTAVGHAPVTLEINASDRDMAYMEHAVLLPWTTPQRTFGFVHPAEKHKVGTEPFTLFGALSFYASVGIQQVGPTAFRPVEGPKLLLPFELVSPLTLTVYDCPTAIWLSSQDELFKEMMHALLVQLVDPPRIQPAAGGLIKT